MRVPGPAHGILPFMRPLLTLAILAVTLAGTGSTTAAQELSFREMRWRDIGPTRAGRARALAGVPSQPNTFYAGFDNGGVWRSTDYGANWVPLFDDQSTGSIGAIAVAPSNPDIIYVGTGAGIIRPDLAIGNGMYKSTDAGRTWQHLGLRDSQMIAAIAVDPGNADRLFVAVLGHPYGPNAERGVFRSTDGGRTFEKVLFKDDYTSANEVLLDPRNPNVALRDAVVAATELHRGPGIRQHRHGHLQVDRRRDDLGAARRRAAAGGSAGEHRDRAERSERALRRHRTGTGADRLLHVHRRRRALVPGDSRSGRAGRIGAGHAAARAHRRRRPADRHRRSQGSEGRLHRLDGDVAHDGRRADVERRARRARRRRLPAHLDQPDQHGDHPRRRRSGRGGLRQSRPQLEQLVQPEHRRRCITSRPTTRFPIASARDSRTRAAPACKADRTTAASRSTTGIR